MIFHSVVCSVGSRFTFLEGVCYELQRGETLLAYDLGLIMIFHSVVCSVGSRFRCLHELQRGETLLEG